MGGPPDNPPGTTERVRLHITPFNRELLDRIIAPSIQPLASNISFHSVQTFPERGFGYIELPAMEAQKLKKKLNGSTLKGSKVRIEEAKPERKRKGELEEDDRDAKARKTTTREKKKTWEEGSIPGHELKEGRRVKRGWTETAVDAKTSEKEDKKKKKSKSQGTGHTSEGRKLRFKTSIPRNATPIDTNGKSKTKEKKGKEGKAAKKKAVVQEFGKTRKPSMGAVESTEVQHGDTRYEDGVGWVDKAGNVVEAERPSKKPKQRIDVPDPESGASIVGNEETIDEDESQAPAPPDDQVEDDDMSLDEASPEVNKDANVEDEPTAERDATESGNEVHPLEALFKKSPVSPTNSAKPRPKAINTSFSFFDVEAAKNDDDDDDGAGADMPPQTPRTKRDIEWRSLRSAAPTPDTAAIGRKLSFPFAQESDEEDDEDGDGGEDAEMADAEQAEQGTTQMGEEERGEESAFRKWFYDNRGDLNRGWKKRRRDEKKRKRQTENRRLSRRVV